MKLLGITNITTLHNTITQIRDEAERDMDMTTEIDMYNYYDGVLAGLGTVLALMEIPQE